MEENFNKGRIAQNTGFLYIRMLFTMGLNLLSTRLILQNLGVEDMGVQGIVSSIVSVFSFFNSGLATTLQRFMSVEIGYGRKGDVSQIFSTSLSIVLFFITVLLIILESAGSFILNNFISIPSTSLFAANIVYQLSILTCLINVLLIPFMALIIANERMGAFAWISTLQVLLTTLITWGIGLFDENRLIIYTIGLTLISVGTTMCYALYCHRQLHAHISYSLTWNRDEIKKMGKFVGVTSLADVLLMIANQGIVFIINWTLGVAFNAIYSIALQLKNSVMSFAFNVFKAMAPQITKTFVEGNYELHKKIVYTGAKIQVFLIFLILIPFLFQTDLILQLWLKEVPPYTNVFCQATIFLSLNYAAFEPIRTAVLATGRISRFMFIPNTFQLIVLPVSLLIAYYTNNPTLIIIIIVVIDILTCLLRIWYGMKVSPLQGKELISQVLQPCLIVLLFGSLSGYFFSQILPANLYGFITLLVIQSIALLVIIYFVGITRYERTTIKNYISRLKLNKKVYI